MDEADSIASQPLVIHLLYTVQDPISTARQSSYETVFTLSLYFLVDQVEASLINAEEGTL